MLMSDAGTDFDAVGVTLTFDDNAAIAPPNSAQLVSGTFRPSNYLPDETLPLPAPPPPYGSALSAFNGTNPNGMWSLFVSDDTSEDGGSIDGGWSLTITTTEPIADLAVTQRASPNPTAVGTNVTLALTITNLGPAPASNVILTDALPAGLTFISVASSSGSCSNNAGLINCNWPNLPVGAGANVSILVQPALGGFFTNTVLGGGQELDVAPSN